MLPHPITVSEPSLDSILSLHLTAFWGKYGLCHWVRYFVFYGRGKSSAEKSGDFSLAHNWKAQIRISTCSFSVFPEFVYRIDLPKCFNPTSYFTCMRSTSNVCTAIFLYILKIARDCWYQESAKEENSFQIVDFVCSSNHFEICSYRNYFMSKPNAAEGSFQNLMYCVTLESFKK